MENEAEYQRIVQMQKQLQASVGNMNENIIAKVY